MTPTHKDGLSEENAARILEDEEKTTTLMDLPAIVSKIIGLVASLFLVLLSASPKLPGLGLNTWFVIPAAIALCVSVAWAAWFETLIYQRLALGCIWFTQIIIIAGIVLHIPNPEEPPVIGLILGITAIAAAIAFTWLLASRKILYPKLDFFLPATAVLCLAAILTVL